jgi:biopolymer transport protein ExbB
MESNVSTMATIAEAFATGGIWMWSIMVVQIASIAIMVERFIALYVVKKPNQVAYAEKFERDIRQGDIQAVVSNSQRSRMTNPLSYVVEAGAKAARDQGGREEIQAKMDEVLLSENGKLERRTGFLAMLGNVGTLLGLLGTIIGLIQAFASVENANAVEKAALLTKGVALAMNTTAYGLIMAIPALVMYAVLQNRANILSEDLNQGALKVFNWLSFNYENVGEGAVKKTTRASKKSV